MGAADDEPKPQDKGTEAPEVFAVPRGHDKGRQFSRRGFLGAAAALRKVLGPTRRSRHYRQRRRA
jgi:hypothetical protein